MKKNISIILAILMCFSCFSMISFAEETDSEHITTVPDGYIGVYTKDDLFNIHRNTSASYILMNNIVFDESDFDDNYNDGNGWIPIASFSGTFDGNGYKISNIRISGEISNVGFFESLTTSSTVKNLYIENINIDVTGSNVGGMTGTIEVNDSRTSSSIISNCKVSGNIKGSSRVAGFCGYFYIPVDGGDRQISLIKNCCNAANIYGNTSVGGIIGYQNSGANSYGYYGGKDGVCQIFSCTNTGKINGKTSIGGIIGYAYESTSTGTYGRGVGNLDIYNCYNCGEINANSLCGGIIGNANISYSSAQIDIIQCYNTGNITSTVNENVGAITGTGEGSVSNVYYLNNSVTNPTNTLGQSLTSDKLKITDMGSDWTFDGCEKYKYPELIDVEPIFQLSGTAIISSVSECNSILQVETSTITPDFANVYIAWIADGLVVGEGTTYIVSNNDIGKTIYAKLYSEDCVVGSLSSESLIITKIEHNYISEVSTPATHLIEGLITYTCTCGDTYTEAIAKTTEHTYTAVVTAPTCTEQGYTTYTCECGDTYVSDYVKENGHSHTATVTAPATHLTEGVMTYTCDCGDVYTEAIEKTTEHSYTPYIYMDATCTKNGIKEWYCACGDSYEETIPATGHADTNHDGACDICNKTTCSHMCHQSGFNGFIWKIVQFFWRLFKMNPICECGAAHY